MPSLETASGARVAYLDWGSGPPLVLVHGWAMSSAVLTDLGRALEDGRRVIVPDLRGHGASSPGGFGLEDLAGDLAALLDALALRDVALAGWSMGGQVALAAMPRVRRRVARLALLSTTPRFTAGEGWPHGLPAQHVEVLAHRVRRDPTRALPRFFDGMFAPGELDDGARARVAALRDALPPPAPAAAQAGLDLLVSVDLRGALRAVDVPTLVVHGGADPICPAGAGRALADAIPGARLVVFPGAGHAPFLSRPAAVAGALRPFLAGEA
ncbi:alpha/beta fold hydrolase [Anaeromyxobacter oryzae]|uniref:O-methylpimelyl-ACP methylesterase n=1 Tax=Anaeromyxobacter oryzae TaxID=2918170 RepID=A0ABM7WT45_9BACT|nr:alpha/beta fold hydrolase [Anaeromyxobacter oryzae]BDG02642.1 O-methylpimelyl-ACP methylesterase [Anaeromyxobacter oryzae]